LEVEKEKGSRTGETLQKYLCIFMKKGWVGNDTTEGKEKKKKKNKRRQNN